MAPALSVDALAFSPPGRVSSSNDFTQLVSDLSTTLGPSSGLDSADVDLLELTRLMENYESNEDEWAKFALADSTRGYTRNLVDEGNGKSNLLVLVWTPGKSSPIHDHANAHCLMKVLKGSLRETRYSRPDAEMDGSSHVPQILKETVYKAGQVTYMSDELGLHRIGNVSSDEIAVSLHLYTPPNAAREGCNIFNEKTGKASHVSQSNFYSVHGVKTGI